MRLPSPFPALLLAAGLLLSACAQTPDPANDEAAAYGPGLEGFDYPHPVQRFRFTSQGQPLQMAYMDIAPAQAGPGKGRTVVLLHGKNFCAATWQGTIAALSQAGYRVIAPDQIGFCKSTKPQRYQYSFQQLAHNTRELLAWMGIERATVIGHSTGGMLAVRYLAGLNRGPGKEIVAWNSALVYDMIYTQPVVHEFGEIEVPTLLLIGHKDTTAIGKDRAPPQLAARLGNYAELGKRAAAAIPGAELVEFDQLGHAPQIQDPKAFHAALLGAMQAGTKGR